MKPLKRSEMEEEKKKENEVKTGNFDYYLLTALTCLIVGLGFLFCC